MKIKNIRLLALAIISSLLSSIFFASVAVAVSSDIAIEDQFQIVMNDSNITLDVYKGGTCLNEIYVTANTVRFNVPLGCAFEVGNAQALALPNDQSYAYLCVSGSSRISIGTSSPATDGIAPRIFTITPENRNICGSAGGGGGGSGSSGGGGGGGAGTTTTAPAGAGETITPSTVTTPAEGEEEIPTEEQEPEEEESFFDDVPEDHWAYSGVQAIAARSIMKGKGNRIFDGSAPTLRAEMAAIILRSLGEDCGEGYDAPFKDVDTDQWFAPCISKAYAKGILKGDRRGRARPGDTITRAEIMAMFFRAFEIEVPEELTKEQVQQIDFKDFNATAWWAPYIYSASQRGILLGYPDETIRPTNVANRYEIAVIGIRFLDYLVQF